MENPHQEYIDSFRKKGAEYWLFSKAELARWARVCNDVPVEVVDGLTEEQAQQLCAEIRKKLARGQYYEIYVKVLVHLEDASAIEVLQTLKKQFKERQKRGVPRGSDWMSEIRHLDEAIRHLKSTDKPLKPAGKADGCQWLKKMLSGFKMKSKPPLQQ